MMRAPYQPLAHLVDAAAEKWLAVENASEQERLIVRDEITQAFHIGEQPELTFHGSRYLLSVIRSGAQDSDRPQEFLVKVHKIAVNN